MEISSFRSLADQLGMDDHPLFLHQWPTNNNINSHNVELSTESIASLIYEDHFHHSFSHQQPTILDFKRASESSGAGSNRPSKHLKTTNTSTTTTWDTCNTTINLPCESIASFGNQQNYNNIVKPTSQGAITNTRLVHHQTPYDHILAERKRREKISQRFIALTALVPGLKKMDKASVLGDAVKYLKQLQEKIKILEEKTKTKSMEKLVFVKKYENNNYSSSSSYDDDDESFSCNNGGRPTTVITETLPEIQARFCDKDVLIIINCEKRKGVLEKAVAEIEKLNLSVANSCVMAFGDCALNITLLAKKDEEFVMNMKELANNLRGALKILM